VRAFLAGQSPLIRSPTAIRPWQFVLEPLRGYLLLAERLSDDAARFAGGWNFGPEEADVRPVSWLADELARQWGQGACWSNDSGTHPHEAHFLRLDAAKARTLLGWQPRLRLAQSLEWIVEWYRAFQDVADLRRLTQMQIERYEALWRPAAGAS
jgi:CDP-glucose 4,6-dehydratase